jgi:hypothetical protein
MEWRISCESAAAAHGILLLPSIAQRMQTSRQHNRPRSVSETEEEIWTVVCVLGPIGRSKQGAERDWTTTSSPMSTFLRRPMRSYPPTRLVYSDLIDDKAMSAGSTTATPKPALASTFNRIAHESQHLPLSLSRH